MLCLYSKVLHKNVHKWPGANITGENFPRIPYGITQFKIFEDFKFIRGILTGNGNEVRSFRNLMFIWATIQDKTAKSTIDSWNIETLNLKKKQNFPEEYTLKLKLKCFGDIIRRHDLLEKCLMLGRIGG